MKRIALEGQARIQWTRLRGRAAAAVHRAVKRGDLADLKAQIIECADCPQRATVYDHEDYTKPLEVEAVCGGCNIARGTNANGSRSLRKEQPHCEKCGSRQVLYRRSDGISWCRVCGHEWKTKQEKKKHEQ